MSVQPQKYDKPNVPLRQGANPNARDLSYAAGQLGYAQITTDQGGIVAPTDITGLSSTVTIGANRRIKITGVIISFNTSAGVVDGLYIMEGAVILQRALIVTGAVSSEETLTATYITTPTSGAHTYKLRADRSAGTMTARGAANSPAFILIEDIGAA